jgi:hypothetical protein
LWETKERREVETGNVWDIFEEESVRKEFAVNSSMGRFGSTLETVHRNFFRLVRSATWLVSITFVRRTMVSVTYRPFRESGADNAVTAVFVLQLSVPSREHNDSSTTIGISSVKHFLPVG